MTRDAWIMMLSVWAVVVFFAGYFLWRVLMTPQKLDSDDENSGGGK